MKKVMKKMLIAGMACVCGAAVTAVPKAAEKSSS